MKALELKYHRVAYISDSNSLLQNYPPNMPLNLFDWIDLPRSQTWLIFDLWQIVFIRTLQDSAEAALCWNSVLSQYAEPMESRFVTSHLNQYFFLWFVFFCFFSVHDSFKAGDHHTNSY